MEPFLLVIGAAVVAVVIVRMYNGFVQRRLRTDGAWAQIDVQLKRRHDLVPNLVAAAEGVLTGALRSLFAVVENYPDLKASENVGALQGQLATTEDQIGAARDVYNGAVRAYNTAITTFPARLMARSMGFTLRGFFEAEAEAGEIPSVQLR